MAKQEFWKRPCESCGAMVPVRYVYTLSNPRPANQYWPGVFILVWVEACCRKQAHSTEVAASFGERGSNRAFNQRNSTAALGEFNQLPVSERTVDNARRIVRKHGGQFIYDRWLDHCASWKQEAKGA